MAPAAERACAPPVCEHRRARLDRPPRTARRRRAERRRGPRLQGRPRVERGVHQGAPRLAEKGAAGVVTSDEWPRLKPELELGTGNWELGPMLTATRQR